MQLAFLRNTPPLSLFRDSIHRIGSITSFLRTVWQDAPSTDQESFYDSTVQDYAALPLTKLTLREMLDLGKDAWFDDSKIIQSARICQEQLPRRLARRLVELQLLPHIVVSNPHINNVYRAYHYAFETLKNHPPVETLKDNETFSSLLRRLVDEHSPLLDSLASGLRDCKRKPHVGGRLHLDGFLESMLRSRISRRVIAEQHLGLGQPRPGYVGIICTELSLADSVDLAAQRCRQVCIETYGIAPDVVTSGDRDLSMAYIPHHVDYMLYEVLKNAARAVVEHHHHHQQQQQLLPSLLVRICGGDDDVTIRVSDQGGGITKDDLSRVFEYGFTTVDDYSGGGGGGGQQLSILYPPSEGLGDVGISNNNNNSSSNSSSSSSVSAAFNAAEILGTAVTGGGHSRFRMAGLGFGLPLSRLYARYFGGDLTLFSLPGYGVDVYLRLQRLEGTEWAEVTTDDPVTPPLSVSVDTIIDQNSGGGGRSRKVVD